MIELWVPLHGCKGTLLIALGRVVLIGLISFKATIPSAGESGLKSKSPTAGPRIICFQYGKQNNSPLIENFLTYTFQYPREETPKTVASIGLSRFYNEEFSH